MSPRKKAQTKTTKETDDVRIVKVRGSSDEIRDLRVAAALEESSLSDFLREAGMERAGEVIGRNYPKSNPSRK